MAQEAIDAYRDFHDALNEFGQHGYPADQQGKLRLHVSGEYAERIVPNWSNSRKYGLTQSGQARLETIDVVTTAPEDQEVTLNVCEDLTGYEIQGPDGQKLRTEGFSDYVESTVTLVLKEERYEGRDYWVVTSVEPSDVDEC